MPKTDAKTAIVILAAGLSTRFGGDKLRADLNHKPLALWALDASLSAKPDRLLAVTRPEMAGLFSPALDNGDIVINPDPTAGQSASLSLALQRLAPDITHLLYVLADQPLLDGPLLANFLQLAQDGVGLAALRDQGHLSPPCPVQPALL